MLTMGDDDELRRYPWLSILQALLIALLVAGTALVLGGARPWVMLPAYGVAGALLLTQIVRLLLTRNSPLFRFDLLDGFAAAFLIYAVVRYATGPAEYAARFELLNIFSYAVVFWVARYGLTHSSHGLFLLYAIAAAGLAAAGFALWLKFNPGYLPYGENLHHHYAPRLTGTFGCPNHLGSFLVMATCATLGLAMFLRGWWPVRVILFYVAGVLIVVIGLTLSRGSWLGLLAAFFALTVFCVRHSSLKWYYPVGLFAVAVVAGLGTLLFVPAFSERLQEIVQHWQNGTMNSYVRVQLAQDALKIWQDHPWWGSGPGTFAYLHPRYHGPYYNTLAYYTHNDYLNLLSDYGAFGAGLVVPFLLGATLVLGRSVDHRARSSQRIILCAATAAWAALLVHSTVDFNLHIPACGFALFALTGLGLRRGETMGAHLPYGQQQVINVGFALLLLAVLGCFTILVYRTAAGFYPYWNAVQHSTKLRPNDSGPFLPFEEATVLLQRSIAADPGAVDSLSLLGDFYRVEAGRASTMELRREMAQEAIRYYQRAQKANPLDDGILLKLGLVYDAIMRFDEAFLCFRTITEHQPYNGFFQEALGRHFLQRGRLEPALAAYEQALKCPYGPPGLAETAQLIRARLEGPPVPDHPPTLP